MGYISVEWGLIKVANILFGLFIIFVGIYPFIYNSFIGFPYVEDKILHFIIIFIGALQVIISLKSRRPRIN